MDSEEENRNQRNKGHKQKNRKLEKKRDKEKDLKKAKKLKKQAYELLREEKRVAFFAQKDKKKKKQRSKSSSSRSRSRSESISNSSQKSESQLLKNSLRSRSSSIQVKQSKQNQMQKIISQKQEQIEKMEQNLNQQVPSQPVKQALPAKKYGPSMPPDFDRKTIEEKLKQNITSQQVEQKNDKAMDQFLEGVFGGGQKGHLSQFLDTRVKQPKKQIERELKHEQVEYLGGKLENTEMSQDELKRFMQEWDQENRGKSLMQIHQEKKRQEMMQNQKQYGAAGIRKEFNRDTDLNYFKQDSKRIMYSMQQSGSLNTKFGQGNIQNSFI